MKSLIPRGRAVKIELEPVAAVAAVPSPADPPTEIELPAATPVTVAAAVKGSRLKGNKGSSRGGRAPAKVDPQAALIAAYEGRVTDLVNLPMSADAITLGQHPRVTTYLLAKQANPNQNSDQAIIVAARMGQLSTLRQLIEAGANPAAQENAPIRFAAESGHDEALAYLLQQPNTNPSDRQNQALKLAETYRHQRCVKLLLADSRVQATATAALPTGV
jgi:hypothetical protein